MTIGAIILAAGEASRFGGVLKQFVRLNGDRLADRAVAYARTVGAAPIVLVAPAGWTDPCGADLVVAGGGSRGRSICAGLEALGVWDADQVAAGRTPPDLVMVHDAARPLAEPELLARTVQAVIQGADVAVPGVALDDSLGEVQGGRLLAAPTRGDYRRLQTPEVGTWAALGALHGRSDVNTLSELADVCGLRCAVVEGSAFNFKITRPVDLFVAEQLAQQEDADQRAPDLSGHLVALIGRTGAIGDAVDRALWAAGAVVEPIGRSEWDLRLPPPIGLLHRLARLQPAAVVHAAGVLEAASCEELFAVNFGSIVHLAAAAPVFMPSGGCLVVLGSSAAAHGRADQPLYAASKAAVNNFVEGKAIGLAAHGIHLNAVCPCRVASPMRTRSGFSVDGAVALEDVARAVVSYCATTRGGRVVQVRPFGRRSEVA